MESIRGRLLHALILTLLAMGALTAAAIFWTARSEIGAVLDGELRQVALSLRDHLDGQRRHHDAREPDERILVQVWDECDSSVYLSRPAPTLPTSLTPGFATIPYANANWRVYTEHVGCRRIQVAQPMSLRTELAVGAAFRILQPMLLLLPILGLSVWLIVGGILASLDRVSRTVAARKAEDIDPIDTQGLPTEVRRMVEALNRLLARLADSLAIQKQFASDAAHELRTPLTAIRLQVQLAERAKTEAARARHFARIQEGLTRATRLIEQLLAMARLDPESGRQHSERINLKTLVEAVREEMAPVAAQKGIQIGANAQEVWVQGAEPALRLLATNLTDNAIRYTPEGGRIELRCRLEHTDAVLEVADNGRGIAPEDRLRVFERYQRAGKADTKGTGLGLAIVKRVATLHGGEVAALDGLDGAGTTVRLTMPATTPETI